MAASRGLLCVVVILATAACGEDVKFTTVLDAGPDDVSLPPIDSPAPPDANVRRGFPMGFAHDSACPAELDAGPDFCQPNGSLCHAPRDCCTGRCEQGYCLPMGTCYAPDAPCDTRGDCCSGRCEPMDGTGPLVCSQYCQAEGASCDNPNECCSLGCNGGKCGGPLCVVAGGTCVVDSQCCSVFCNRGVCFRPPSACVGTGEGCSPDGGATCCTGFCNGRTGRCDLTVSGMCLEPSSPCYSDNECCRPLGRCMPNKLGIDVCTVQCQADGQDCNSSGECCDGLVCTGFPQRCAALPPGCP
jgi:hypothetical protein